MRKAALTATERPGNVCLLCSHGSLVHSAIASTSVTCVTSEMNIHVPRLPAWRTLHLQPALFVFKTAKCGVKTERRVDRSLMRNPVFMRTAEHDQVWSEMIHPEEKH